MSPALRKDLAVLAVLGAAAAALYFFNLGGYALLDPTEPFYALSAREMLARGDWGTPYLFGSPQFEKPALYYWALCASFAAAGVSELSARVPSALAGIALVWAAYAWGRALFGRVRPALLSALLLGTAAECVVLSRTAFTDVFLCLFTTGAMACFSAALTMPPREKLLMRAVFAFCGLAFLTKGPIGLLVPLSGITAYVAAARRGDLLRRMPWGSGLVLFLLVALPWYAWMTFEHGTGFLRDFFLHENVRRFFVAEHRGMDRPWFYPAGLLLGFFPWTPLVLAALGAAALRLFGRGEQASRERTVLLLCLALVPLWIIAQSKSKLLTYIFPAFPPLALLAGDWLDRAARAGAAHVRVPLKALVCLGWIAAPAALAAAAWTYDARHGLGLRAPIGAAALAAALPLGAACILFCAGRPRAALAAALGSVFALSLACFGWLLPAASPHFSSKHIAASLRPEDDRLLSSKMFVRGIAFYAPRPVALSVVAEYPKRVFYTAPPLPFVSGPADLEGIRTPVRAALRPKELDFLGRIAGADPRVELIERRPLWALAELRRTSDAEY